MLEKSILSAFACDTCVSPVLVLFVVVGNISWSAITGAVASKCFAPLHWAHLEGVFAQAPALLKGSMKPFQPYIWSKPLVEGINSI